MNYPIWDLQGSGLLIAIVSIVHVFVSHFAVGGGLFLVLAERKARRDNDAALLGFVRYHSPLLHPADAGLRRDHRRRDLVHDHAGQPVGDRRASSTPSSGAGRSSGPSS